MFSRIAVVFFLTIAVAYAGSIERDSIIGEFDKQIKGGNKKIIKKLIPEYHEFLVSNEDGFWVLLRAFLLVGKMETASILFDKRYGASANKQELLEFGKILSAYGYKPEGEAVLAKLLSVDSTNAEAYFTLANLALKQSFTERLLAGRNKSSAYSKALFYAGRASSIDSLNPEYAFFRISILDSMKMVAEGCALCSVYLETIRPDAKLNKICGAINEKNENYDAALKHWEKAFHVDSFDVDNLLKIESAHRRLGTHSSYELTAQERLANALPDTLSIRYNLALELIKRDSLERAKKELTKVLSRNKNFAEANKAMAAVLSRMNRNDEALHYLQNQRTVSGGKTGDRYSEAVLLLAKGDTLPAIFLLDKVVSENAEHYDARYILATILYNEGEWDKIDALIKIPEKHRDVTGALVMAATALFKTNADSERAYEYLKRCENSSEADENVYYMLAELSWNMEKYAEAKRYFEKCLLQYPDSRNVDFYKMRIKKADSMIPR